VAGATTHVASINPAGTDTSTIRPARTIPASEIRSSGVPEEFVPPRRSKRVGIAGRQVRAVE
jgi:hypothetical protein